MFKTQKELGLGGVAVFLTGLLVGLLVFPDQSLGVDKKKLVRAGQSAAPKYYVPGQRKTASTTSAATEKSGANQNATANEQTRRYQKVFADFETSMGNFRAELYPLVAPRAVENFVGLATGTKKFINPQNSTEEQRPFYDGLIFHRIIPNFIIQSGCPLGNGTGGPGYRFPDEFHPLYRHAKPGMLAMANAAPNSNGSQFFITLAAAPDLDKKHTIFGEVVSGMNVVEAIGRVKTTIEDKPIKDVVLKRVTISYK